MNVYKQGEIHSIIIPSHPLYTHYHTQTTVSHGTVLLSMCYSTDSKKLSIILLRAKDLNRENAKETGQLGITYVE